MIMIVNIYFWELYHIRNLCAPFIRFACDFAIFSHRFDKVHEQNGFHRTIRPVFAVLHSARDVFATVFAKVKLLFLFVCSLK